MVNYMNLMETKINTYLEATFRMSVNYEALAEVSQQQKNYFEEIEKESLEISEMLDKRAYPKSIKLENNNKYIEILERHEKEINELT